jgi:hypothetical protein
MSQVISLYKNILDEVINLENKKREISIQILLTKNESKRLNLISSFLTYDLNKHELLERAAVIAVQNKELNVLEQLQKMYSHCEDDELLNKIRKEIKYIKRFRKNINKAVKYPDFLSFFERRMIQEISKYVVEQARIYAGFQ